jgi:hypothetical protein
MKQFLITTATIAVLSLPVYYLFDPGSAPAPVAKVVEAVTDQDTVGDTGWLTEEDKQRIIANTIEGQGDKTAKAMIDGMETIAAGLNVPEEDDPQGDSLTVRVADVGSPEASGPLTVTVAHAPDADGKAADLFGGDSPGPVIEDAASNADDDGASVVASQSVVVIGGPDRLAGATGNGPSIRFVGSYFRVPRAMLNLADFDTGDEGRFARDYPTSFLWFYLA